MKTVLLVLGLTAAMNSDEANRQMTAYLEFMKLSYACSPDAEHGPYRSAKAMAQRALLKLAPAVTLTVRDVTNLDRRLRNGSIKLDRTIDTSDCENLLLESKADLDALK